MDKERQTVESRIGILAFNQDAVIRFPRGIIGFDSLRDFILVEYRASTPFQYLQSLENKGLGMLLADPFAFLPRYEVRLGSAEEHLLGVKSIRDVAVLVSVSVPKGNPQGATLNLSGPICVNVQKRIGLQVPQIESVFPARVLMQELGTQAV